MVLDKVLLNKNIFVFVLLSFREKSKDQPISGSVI